MDNTNKAIPPSKIESGDQVIRIFQRLKYQDSDPTIFDCSVIGGVDKEIGNETDLLNFICGEWMPKVQDSVKNLQRQIDYLKIINKQMEEYIHQEFVESRRWYQFWK